MREARGCWRGDRRGGDIGEVRGYGWGEGIWARGYR